VLGNDPFERGAAVREPVEGEAGATATATPTPTSTATPTASPTSTATPTATADATPDEAVHDHVDDHDRDHGEARPVARGPSTLAALEEEAKVAVGRLLPALRARLGTLADLVRLLEPSERLDRYGMDARFAERLAPLVEFFYATWWRVQVRGIDAVPGTGPALVVANHAGLVPWDAFVLRHALLRDHPAHRQLRPLLDDREVELPVVGPAAVRAGAVRAAPEAAGRILAAGDVLGVFPEGSAGARKPWRDRYTLVHFGRGGFVKVALRAGAPVVPCAIVGSEEASAGISRTGWLAERLGVPLLAANTALRLTPAALLPLPSRWTLRFGEPIETASFGREAGDDPAVVNRLAEQVRSVIQAMLDEDVASRTSVFL
jgi:1-acyl-sn-glycerol-3-phosphate acyltransferase